MTPQPSFSKRLWSLCCSLKLAIVLASGATFLAMAGSLVMHFNPNVFGGIDQQTLIDWWQTRGTAHLRLSWWLILFATLVLLLGINTLCCFIDWLGKIRARWRKLGEYLIHLGCVLVLGAYIWGSFSGFRHDSVPLYLNQPYPIGGLPGHYLRLDHFEPRLSETGRPLDMRSRVTLLRGDQQLAAAEVSINHPLLWRGLVVVPVSFGRNVRGFRFFQPQRGALDLEPGSRVKFDSGSRLTVETFYPDAAIRDGRVLKRGNRLGDPAMLLRLEQPGQAEWRGWYFLRGPLPYPLVSAGIRIRPTQPLFRVYSVLTINYDPGSRLALAGGILIISGILIAMASFYRKRRCGDHPDIR